MKAGSKLLVICTAMLVGACGAAAWANDTSINLSIDPPEPLDEEYVPIRMESEHLEIWLGEQYSEVKVEFVFRNISERKSYTWAGFPDEDMLYTYLSKTLVEYTYEDGRKQYYSGPDGSVWTYTDREEAAGQGLVNDEGGVIFNFTAWTRSDGASVDANTPLHYLIERMRRDLADDEAAMARDEWGDESYTMSVCRVFKLFLEPDEAVVVGHQYTTPNGGMANGQKLFSYTLSTGANWKDTIGKTVIDVYLADGLTVDDVCWESPVEWVAYTHPARDQWQVVDDKHLRLVYEDYEPEGDTGYVFLSTHPAPQYVEYEAERKREEAAQAGESGANNEQS